MADTVTTLTAVAYPSIVTSDGLLAFLVTGANTTGGGTLSSFAITVNNSTVAILEGPSSLSVPERSVVSAVLIVNGPDLLGAVTYQITAWSSTVSGPISSNSIPVVVQTNSIQPITPSNAKQEDNKTEWVVLWLLLVMGAAGFLFYRRTYCCAANSYCAVKTRQSLLR